MSTKRNLARTGLTEALRARKSAGVQLWEPVCVFDLAGKLGVEVRFEARPSMEGMFVDSSPPRILVSSLRPPGRKAYNCAHELGHHRFGHGTRVDEFIENHSRSWRSEPEEYLADSFASYLLMPKIAVERGLAIRKWKPDSLLPEQVYVLAGWFGVGYTTLVYQMRYSLGMITQNKADRLLKARPKDVRAAILGQETDDHLVVVDDYWGDRPVDMSKGDYVLAPPEVTVEGNCVEVIASCDKRTLLRGTRPGLGRLTSDDLTLAAYVRVSRYEYTGRSVFRHLEDPDDDE